MVAPNKQPSGSKPGPGTAHTHPEHDYGRSPGGSHNAPKGGHSGVGGSVAPHGTPAKVGNNKKNPLH